MAAGSRPALRANDATSPGVQEFRVVVRAPGQESEDVLRRDHRQRVGLEVAADRRDHDGPAGAHERRAGRDDRSRIGHVLEQFHAGDDVERARHLGRERLRGDEAIFDRGARFELVQPGDAERLVAEVDAQRHGAARGHGFGQDPAAAADVDHALAVEPAARPVDPVEAQRIHPVQRPEHRAVRIPPVMGERGELRELARVDVAARIRCRRVSRCDVRVHCSRSCQSRADAASAASSAVCSARSATTRLPATQTSVTASRPTAWTRWETGS